MISYERGDVVLVGFLFPDQTGIKRRPAAIISSRAYHQGRQEVIIAAITSNTTRVLPGDTMLGDWKQSGLLLPSLATGIIRNVKQRALLRKLGSLTASDLQTLNSNLRQALEL